MPLKFKKVLAETLIFLLVLSGVGLSATRITNDFINTTGTMNATDIFEGNERLEDKYVLADTWTSIDDYPSDCAAGEFARGLGDTLTCAADQDTDSNASSICSGAEILLGNGSCVSDTNYLDDTTIADTDSNASSICSGDEVLLGNTSCISSAGFFDDTTIADTDSNASSICSGDEALLGNGSCVSSAAFFDDTDTHRGNTTGEIWAVVNNGTFQVANGTFYLGAYTYSGLFGINNLSKCSDGQILKMSGASWACGVDVTGSGGGAGLWMVTTDETTSIDWMTPNETAGGKQHIVGTGMSNWSSFQSSADLWCNEDICYSLEDFFDDTNTNASSECSNDEALLGNGSCHSLGNYLTSASDTDTNASSICSGDEALLGNGSCVSSATFFDDTNTHRGNTTAEISQAVNDSGVPYASITGHPADDDQPDDDSEVPDDITISASGKNITTTVALVSDADNQGFYDGADQDFHQYFNGTCEIFVVGSSEIHLCP
jgi:predicted RecA/RadA family phage recombinase